MTRGEWHRQTSREAAARRAGGRRHYNQIRQQQALRRRLQVAKLVALGYTQTAIAQELQVHRSTITRNLQRLQEQTLRPSVFLRP